MVFRAVFLFCALILADADKNFDVNNNTEIDDITAFGKNNAVNMTENKVEAKQTSVNITKMKKDALQSFVNNSQLENDKQVYLEDIFSGLKNIKWEDDQEICLNHTMLMLKSLQNYTLWAVWMWDSMSPEPYGLFYGAKHHLGNFDQCLYPPWPPQESGFLTQYCLAEVDLGRKGNNGKILDFIGVVDPHQSALEYLHHIPKHHRSLNELTWGVCVPSSCSQKSIQNLLRVLLLRSHLGIKEVDVQITINERCQRAEIDGINAVSMAFLCTLCVFIGAAIFCTYVGSRRCQSNKKSLPTAVIKTFCMKSNAANLMKIKNDGLQSLYGLRFISICIVVGSHQVVFSHLRPISNGRSLDKVYLDYPGIFMARQDLSVDTFFWMSGLLSFHTLMMLKKPPNPLILILKRYVRLAVGLGVVIFFMSGPFALLGSGPLWTRIVDAEMNSCRKNWWLGLLMLNNYIDTENQCYPISWYIPCDFHFFVVTVIVCCVWRKNKCLGMALTAVLGLASMAALGVITYAYKFPAVQIFSYE
ncbi:Nose resistant to fluoxetine protein 6 [Eumeta japonica]|uniref:Nose resistant to fluoxetine protein 6 n=1 Tax=Eumeta variegata TaxID=151549 RepID=A0A4C1SPN2_EUMVA|nr:Nose resistant to fluoxetine protein 6 [Eumeta japonica]